MVVVLVQQMELAVRPAAAVESEFNGPVSVALEVMQQTTTQQLLETRADAHHLVRITQVAVAAALMVWAVLVQQTARVQLAVPEVQEEVRILLVQPLLMQVVVQVVSFNQEHADSAVLVVVVQVAPAG